MRSGGGARTEFDEEAAAGRLRFLDSTDRLVEFRQWVLCSGQGGGGRVWGWLPHGWEGAQGIAGGLKEQVRGSRGGVPVVIPVGIAAGDLGRAGGSVAPWRGTSCHAGLASQRERRGAGLNGAGAGNVWAARLGRTSGALACGGMGRVRRCWARAWEKEGVSGLD